MVRKISQLPGQRRGSFVCSRTLVLVSSLALAPACTLVVGERPERADDAGREQDAATEEDAGLDAGTREDGGVTTDASSVSDAGSFDAAQVDAASDAGAMVDASATIMDSGGADSAIIDAGPAPDCGTGAGSFWYPDGDEDGYGRSAEAVQACAKPASRFWSLSGGDCKDNDPDVRPQQPNFFGVPYRAANGNDSFDYDCSEIEEANPNQRKLASCGVLELIACSGSGYMPSARTGANVDEFCGSRNIGTCMAGALGLGCSAVPTSTDAEPFKCK